MSSGGPQKVIVADDDMEILKSLKHLLEEKGYDVRVAFDGEAALRLCEKHLPDLLISEIALEGIDGLTLLQKIRQNPRTAHTKMVILTHDFMEGNEVRAFDLGVNDFLYKPLRPKAFLLRLEKKFNRPRQQDQALSTLKINGLLLDSEKSTLIQNEKAIRLPRRTFELFFFLAQNPGVVYERSELLERIWGEGVNISGRTVDVHIRKIREKIGNDYITTFKGIGYKFNKQMSV
jgi:two-component system alkaline phosphatase synthesis response regulator PhoP